MIMGNHRDAWTFGAVDPNSGTTAMLEAGRGFGTLLKRVGSPGAQSCFVVGTAKSMDLFGSTEWAEQNADELKQKAVAYMNMDSAVSGPNFGAASVPSMWQLIRAATREVTDPKAARRCTSNGRIATREANA